MTPQHRSGTLVRDALPWAAALAWSSAALGLFVFATRITETLRTDAHLRHPAGVIAALADDVRQGIVYRPLYDAALGYGGTRYFPLTFVPQVLFLNTFGVRETVYAFAALSVLIFASGFVQLARRLGVPWWIAILAVTTALSARSVQFAIVAGRTDVLAVGLIVWGLVFLAGPPRIFAAAVCFTLAFGVKATAAYAIVAGVAHLASQSRRRDAVALSVFTLAGYGVVLTAIQWFSDGRGLVVLAQSAAGGGTVSEFARGPLILLQSIRANEPSLVVWSALAVCWLVAQPPRTWLRLPTIFVISSALAVAAVMGAPGISYNHLVDLNTAAVLTIAAAASKLSRDTLAAGLAAVSLGLAFGLAPIRTPTPAERARQSQGGLVVAAGKVRGAGPVLAENQLVPLLAGARPYVIDPFIVCALAKEDPRFLAPLLDRLRNKTFGAVVLEFDARDAAHAAWYRDTHFGPGFREALLGAYELSDTVDDYFIFRPKAGG